jgi:tetratricopeptide (TPR) repeat protein
VEPATETSQKDGLEANESVRSLVRSLALAEGFNFYLLVCETPRVAESVFAVLEREVEARREAPVRWVRLDAYEAQVETGMTVNALVERILDRLVAPREPGVSSDKVMILDATHAPPSDDEAWARFFQRMNLARNTVDERLNAPLVLAVPPRLEKVFAHAAPDFWSIRSSAELVEARRQTLPPNASQLANEMSSMIAAPSDEGTLDDLVSLLSPRRELTSDAPRSTWPNESNVPHPKRGDESRVESFCKTPTQSGEDSTEPSPSDREVIDFVRAMCAQKSNGPELLCELVEVLKAETSALGWTSSAALGLVKECISKARLQVTEALPRSESALNLLLGRAQGLLGDLHRERGELSEALASYQEAGASIRTFINNNHHCVGNVLYELSVYLNRLGDMRRDQGDDLGALLEYQEALNLRRREVANARPPTRSEFSDALEYSILSASAWEYSVSRTLRRIGGIYQNRREFDQALLVYEESLRISRALVSRVPYRLDLVHDLVTDLLKTGHVHLARRDLGRARDLIQEGLTAARRALDRGGQYRESSRYDLAVALISWAHLEGLHGHSIGALSAWQEASAELDILTQQDPSNSCWARAHALCQDALSKVGVSPCLTSETKPTQH